MHRAEDPADPPGRPAGGAAALRAASPRFSATADVVEAVVGYCGVAGCTPMRGTRRALHAMLELRCVSRTFALAVGTCAERSFAETARAAHCTFSEACKSAAPMASYAGCYACPTLDQQAPCTDGGSGDSAASQPVLTATAVLHRDAPLPPVLMAALLRGEDAPRVRGGPAAVRHLILQFESTRGSTVVSQGWRGWSAAPPPPGVMKALHRVLHGPRNRLEHVLISGRPEVGGACRAAFESLAASPLAQELRSLTLAVSAVPVFETQTDRTVRFEPQLEDFTRLTTLCIGSGVDFGTGELFDAALRGLPGLRHLRFACLPESYAANKATAHATGLAIARCPELRTLDVTIAIPSRGRQQHRAGPLVFEAFVEPFTKRTPPRADLVYGPLYAPFLERVRLMPETDVAHLSEVWREQCAALQVEVMLPRTPMQDCMVGGPIDLNHFLDATAEFFMPGVRTFSAIVAEDAAFGPWPQFDNLDAALPGLTSLSLIVLAGWGAGMASTIADMLPNLVELAVHATDEHAQFYEREAHNADAIDALTRTHGARWRSLDVPIHQPTAEVGRCVLRCTGLRRLSPALHAAVMEATTLPDASPAPGVHGMFAQLEELLVSEGSIHDYEGSSPFRFLLVAPLLRGTTHGSLRRVEVIDTPTQGGGSAGRVASVCRHLNALHLATASVQSFRMVFHCGMRVESAALLLRTCLDICPRCRFVDVEGSGRWREKTRAQLCGSLSGFTPAPVVRVVPQDVNAAEDAPPMVTVMTVHVGAEPA